MILPINSEKTEIFSQIKSIEKIQLRLADHSLYLKEYAHAKVLFKLIENHLIQLETAERQGQQENDPALYIAANTRIKNHLLRKVQHVKLLTSDHRLEPYARNTLQSLASIIRSLASIEQKLEEAGKERREVSLKVASEISMEE